MFYTGAAVEYLILIYIFSATKTNNSKEEG